MSGLELKLTVAICTWNRASMLQQALESFAKLRIPDGVSWELLVVDNNSSDETPGVIDSFKGELPVRGLFEPNPGKSFALNRAVASAKGQYILFTDDDIKADENWLSAYMDAFHEWPDVVFFGGTVKLWYEGTPPAWLTEVVAQVPGPFAMRELGQESFELNWDRVPYGVNMAVRMSELRSYRFRPDLGPRPGSQLRGEETELARKMLADGYRGRWVPNAIIWHHVPRQRQTVAYIRSFFRGVGESYRIQADGLDQKQFLGRPRWLWRAAVGAELRYRFRRAFSRPSVWISELQRSSTLWGQLFGGRSKKIR